MFVLDLANGKIFLNPVNQCYLTVGLLDTPTLPVVPMFLYISIHKYFRLKMTKLGLSASNIIISYS